ncbi:MAG TPA: hypothetical protein VGO62_03205, partial [Myxococcota bacterium]
SACSLPDFGSLLGGDKKAGCEHSRDCADDEFCDEGTCRKIGDTGEGEGAGHGGEGEGEGEGEGNVTDPRGPQFLQFSTNITTMGPSDTVIFTVVVTDPDGIADVIGGSLIDLQSGASYGAFTTSSTDGSYEISLSWDALNTVAPIDFATTGSRSFTARFFDQAGHTSQESTSITLSCGGSPSCAGSCGFARCGDNSCTNSTEAPDENGNGICNNVCESLDTNQHCGSCSATCSTSCINFGADFGETVYECSCSTGSDCGAFDDACVNSQCAEASLSIDTNNPTNTVPVVELDGQGFDFCNLTDAGANMICQIEGFDAGAVRADGHFTSSGVLADCGSATSIQGCSLTTENSCDVAPIDCGGGSGGADLSCAVDGAISEGSFLETSIAGRSSGRSGTCGGTGAEAGYTFTPSVSRNYEIDGFASAGNTVLYVLDPDCNGSELACATDFATGSGQATTTLFLSAGRTVVIVVDTSFDPGTDVFGEVLDAN